jgi:hypothetical protein
MLLYLQLCFPNEGFGIISRKKTEVKKTANLPKEVGQKKMDECCTEIPI